MGNKKLNKVYSFQKINGTLQGKLSVDKRSHKRNRFVDVLLIVISLMVAVVIWLVASNNAEQTANFNIELNIIGAEQLKEETGLEIIGNDTQVITVHVTGRAQDISAVKASDLIPAINVRDYKGGAGTADFTISLVGTSFPAVTLECYPSVVTLNLDEIVTRTVPVEVKASFDLNGIATASPNTMEITGPKKEIDLISRAQVTLYDSYKAGLEAGEAMALMPVFVNHTGVDVDASVTHVSKVPVAVYVLKDEN